jgi:hypothetical protein
MEIPIYVNAASTTEEIRSLTSTTAWQQYQIRVLTNKPRSVETGSLLIAAVAATGGALGAFITGILGVAQTGKNRKITIRDKAGRELDFPADLPQAQINSLVKVLREMEAPSIKL